MELHFINIVRFAVCMTSLVAAMFVMIKADDNNAMRRVTAILAIVIIYFNEEIGEKVYLLIGSTVETFIALSGVGFTIVVATLIMLLPIFILVHWLIH